MSDCIDHGCKGFGMGYATAHVTVDGVVRSTTMHRAVHYRATGEWPEVVRHTCDNPRCINPEHLIGGTAVDNMRDMRERGRSGDCRNFGAANGRTILTEADCAQIRTTYVKGSRAYGIPALARRFGCGTSQIHRIITGAQRIPDHPA